MPAVTIAQDVRLTPDIPSKSITLATGETLVIERNQDTAHQLSGEFTKTSRACPPFCIQEMSAGEGVETVGEIEVISFLENSVAAGNGLLLDSRMPEWFAKGTIPGAINVPFATLEASNPYRDEIIKALGAQSDGTTWDFAAATGSIAVPSALRTEAGRVDTATLLAALVRKSNPEAAITPTIDTNSNGVEVRVVHAQVKPSATISTQFSLATASAQSRTAFMATLRFTRPFLTPTARSYLAPTASARASG